MVFFYPVLLPDLALVKIEFNLLWGVNDGVLFFGMLLNDFSSDDC